MLSLNSACRLPIAAIIDTCTIPLPSSCRFQKHYDALWANGVPDTCFTWWGESYGDFGNSRVLALIGGKHLFLVFRQKPTAKSLPVACCLLPRFWFYVPLACCLHAAADCR